MKNENVEGAGISFVIMPVEILQDKNLTPSEKILYCYLTLFKSGVCFQSNDKLAEMTGLDESTIKRGLKKLAELKYVFVEFVNNNSAMRRIYVVLDNPKKLEYLIKKGLLSKKIDASTPEQPISTDNTIQGSLSEEDNNPTTAPEPSQAMFPTKTVNNQPSDQEPLKTAGNKPRESLYAPRPKRSDFTSQEEYEKAFYNWTEHGIIKSDSASTV